jgi:HTH-type transcriptional regulator/antitoxin HigA
MNAPAMPLDDLRPCYSTAPLLAIPSNDEELAQLQAALDRILDEVGDDEDHPLMPWLDMIGERIEAYEAEHHPMPEAASPVELLRHLMDVHQLRQSDLPDVGSQGVVSEILAGKRTLNARQCRALADRFGVSAESFLADFAEPSG